MWRWIFTESAPGNVEQKLISGFYFLCFCEIADGGQYVTDYKRSARGKCREKCSFSFDT